MRDIHHGNPLNPTKWSEREGRMMAREEARRHEQRVSPLAPIHRPLKPKEEHADPHVESEVCYDSAEDEGLRIDPRSSPTSRVSAHRYRGGVVDVGLQGEPNELRDMLRLMLAKLREITEEVEDDPAL